MGLSVKVSSLKCYIYVVYTCTALHMLGYYTNTEKTYAAMKDRLLKVFFTCSFCVFCNIVCTGACGF